MFDVRFSCSNYPRSVVPPGCRGRPSIQLELRAAAVLGAAGVLFLCLCSACVCATVSLGCIICSRASPSPHEAHEGFVMVWVMRPLIATQRPLISQEERVQRRWANPGLGDVNRFSPGV